MAIQIAGRPQGSTPGWQSSLFAHEQLTRDELEAELADLVEK